MKVYIKQGGFLNNQNITAQERQSILDAGFSEIELNDRYIDCTFLDFDKNLHFSEDLYQARKVEEKEKEYKNLVHLLVRKKYSIDDELAILRKKETMPEEFNNYFLFVENSKIQAKNQINGGNI